MTLHALPAPNTAALSAYQGALASMAESLAVLTRHVEDHGQVLPEAVNWGHVCGVAYMASVLARMVKEDVHHDDGEDA